MIVEAKQPPARRAYASERNPAFIRLRAGNIDDWING